VCKVYQLIQHCNTGLSPAMKMAHTKQGLLHIRQQVTDTF